MVTPKDRLKVINRVKTLVLKHHFNVANMNYGAWSREVDQQAPALAAADESMFEAGVRRLLAGLKSSHTNFYRSDSQPTKPQHAIGATLRSVEHDGAARWMFLDIYEQSPAAAAGIRPGDTLVAMNGRRARCQLLSAAVLTACSDKWVPSTGVGQPSGEGGAGEIPCAAYRVHLADWGPGPWGVYSS